MYYQTLFDYYNAAKSKKQLDYLIDKIKNERLKISDYGKQLIRNMKHNELNILEDKVKNIYELANDSTE